MKLIIDSIISNKMIIAILTLLLMIVAISVFYKLGKNIGEVAYYIMKKY